MSDYFLYYNCIRNNYYQPHFVCERYTDPFQIQPSRVHENHSECFEAMVIPIPAWIPSIFHSRLLTHTLKNRVSVSTKEFNAYKNK